MLATLAPFAGQAAVVYKWTDPDGLVHYSDQPVPGAEKIFTSTSSTNGATSAAGRTGANAGASGPKKAAPPALAYDRFAITSPVQEQTFFGDESIGVHLALEPGLKPEQTITWHLNGKELDDQGTAATQFTLPHLDRGTYAIAATITDQKSGSSLSTDSISFFVRQPSALSPQHK